MTIRQQFTVPKHGGDVLVQIKPIGRADGYSSEGLIELDCRLKPARFLYTAVHDGLHQIDPEKDELVIRRNARWMARYLRKLGYRREDEA